MFTKYSVLSVALAQIFVFGACQIAQSSPDINPSQFIKIGNGSYYIETLSRKNWFAAYEACRQMKASLIAFENIEEWNLINQYLRDRQIYRKYWTAGTDWAEQGKHVWFSTGQPLSLNIWYPGEPNNYQGEEHCDEAGPGLVPWLNDIVCTTLRIYICKAPEAQTPTQPQTTGECLRENLKRLILIKSFYPGR